MPTQTDRGLVIEVPIRYWGERRKILRLYIFGCWLLQAAVAEEGVGGGSLSTEVLVEHHGILGVA